MSYMVIPVNEGMVGKKLDNRAHYAVLRAVDTDRGTHYGTLLWSGRQIKDYAYETRDLRSNLNCGVPLPEYPPVWEWESGNHRLYILSSNDKIAVWYDGKCTVVDGRAKILCLSPIRFEARRSKIVSMSLEDFKKGLGV